MKVIHDGDAAYEDIMALSLLLLNTEVVAVTVTYGESTPKIGAENMERVCRMLKDSEKIPVAYGVNAPLDECGTRFPEFIAHEANTILAHTHVPMVANSQVTGSAVQLLYNTLLSSDEKITLVATGPLTNIAQLINTHPDCISKIEKLVIMGGALRVPGNISDLIVDTQNTTAEWNIYADPKAAEIVFSSSELPIWLVPLDITSQMPMTRAFYEQLGQESLPAFALIKEMLSSLLQGMGETVFYSQLQFWDSLSAMIAIKPEIAMFEELQLTIDLNSGQTKLEGPLSANKTRVHVATQINPHENAYDLFIKLMNPETRLLTKIGCHSMFFKGQNALQADDRDHLKCNEQRTASP